ncbi:hypothetical protein B0F88_103126 [Methylobacter tundripaludum]|uniref:Uncharacterized protein n=1 Tax=Methylobacter tundripaludum TaxID=173365 RepID=A0A2S6H5H4_9GAMM|nr:hypothetical protein [Methylobacter tundripaludum]PPK72693.1 hypothetical protein B0F88_103126 [Methylobacter tundripaludum]
MTATPYIICRDDEVLIIGEPHNLEALGHALLLKAKMRGNLSCTITDGINKPIRIISSDDIDAADGANKYPNLPLL